MDPLVKPIFNELLESERAVLEDLQSLMTELDQDPALTEQLGELIARMDALFLVVVVGEFNAGKSSFLNALFGKRLLEEGPIPTTAKITVLRYGEEELERQLSEYIVERKINHPLLTSLDLVDTPGTNSIIKQHQTITKNFIPRADLVLFVTSYDRPLTESERTFLEYIREVWGKRLVFILNKADLAKGKADSLHQVIEHIRSGCRELMHFEPLIFPVSSELAFTAKTAETESVRETLWQQSRFEPLEQFIHQTLVGPKQLSLKLTAPLDSARQVLKGLGLHIQERRKVVERDEQHLWTFNTHLSEKDDALKNGHQRYLLEVDNLLLEMERRGVQFLDDTIRVSKIKILRDKDLFKDEFARQVIKDHERQIEDRMNDGVDWLIKQVFTLWNWTLSYFADHKKATGLDATRDSQSDFLYNRAEIFQHIMKEARRKIESYDLKEEARRILENANNTASLFLGAQAVAASIGAVATILVLATAADAVGGVGFVSAGALALLGLFMLPRQRRQAIREFQTRIQELRRDMKTALSNQFNLEIDQAMAKIRNLVDPFASLVAEERKRLTQAETGQTRLEERITVLQMAVQQHLGEVELKDS